MGYLSEFIQATEWWAYYPADELLVEQPGLEVYNAFVSVVAKADKSSVMAYMPKPGVIKLRNLLGLDYEAEWYNPQTNESKKAEYKLEGGLLIFRQTEPSDMVLKLDKK